MDLKHIIDDLKLSAEDPDEPEDESGHEYKVKKPKYIPEYLSTKRLKCAECGREQTKVIYFKDGVEHLLHPSEPKCSFCVPDVGLGAHDATIVLDRRDPLYFLTLRYKGKELAAILETERAAMERMATRLKCVGGEILDNTVVWHYADGSKVELPLEVS